MNVSEGQLFDLGYRRYQGPKEGRGRARKALFINGIRTSFGIGRGIGAKIMPVCFFGAVTAPAVVALIIVAITGEEIADAIGIVGHSGYYEIVGLVLFIFAGIMAPELLCTDRRSGVLSLYLVRPLTFTDYVVSRWLAFFAVSIAFVYVGQLVLLSGYLLSASDPIEYIRENWLDVPRFLAAGVVVALVTTTIPLAAAAFTTRRANATVFVVGLFIVTAIAAGSLRGVVCKSESLQVPDTAAQSGSGAQVQVTFGSGGQSDYEVCEFQLGEVARWASLIEIGNVPIEVSDMIFGTYDDDPDRQEPEKLPAAVMVAWYIIVLGVPGFLLWYRYRRLAT